MKIIDGRLFDVCQNCAKIVRLDKPLIGSAHICTLPDERRIYAEQIVANYRAKKSALEQA